MTREDITAPNPSFNATLATGHDICAKISAANLSANPRLYANPSSGGWAEFPETADQDNSDLPTWATENWDGSTTIQSIFQGDGVSDSSVYLQVWVAEKQNFYDVAQVAAQVAAGVPISQALF